MSVLPISVRKHLHNWFLLRKGRITVNNNFNCIHSKINGYPNTNNEGERLQSNWNMGMQICLMVNVFFYLFITLKTVTIIIFSLYWPDE